MRGLWTRMRGEQRTPEGDKWETALQIFRPEFLIVSRQEVYEALERHGYYWDGEDWVRRASDE